MDRDEFERIKAQEKEHLRTKKRMQKTMQTLKRRRRVHDAVSAMARRAGDLLQETESLVRTLNADAAESEARMELALDTVESVEAIDRPDEPSDPIRQPRQPSDEASEAGDALDDIDAEMNERAEQIVQQMKMASGPQHRQKQGSRRRSTTQRPSHPTETRQHRRNEGASGQHDDAERSRGDDEEADDDVPASGHPTTTLPEKTMGRMQETDDADTGTPDEA
jgi:hypothetical protein